MSEDVLCVGECLWDALPDGLFLGGAPVNVAGHLAGIGTAAALVSRVGADRLGREARRRVRAAGVDTALVQVDDERPTGFVRVDLDGGEPDYEILAPAAWDALAWTEALAHQAVRAPAIVFGTLAQRAEPSRATIQRLCTTASDALRVCDVNLRPPHVDRDVVAWSLQVADVVKLNADELRWTMGAFDLSADPATAVAEIADRFACSTVCVTRGADGARIWHEGERVAHPGIAVDVVDTVGAGDAFLAALLAGLLADRPADALLDPAIRLGAYVATRRGARPDHNAGSLDAVASLVG